MTEFIEAINKLKKDVSDKENSLLEVQNKLSVLLYSKCDFDNVEKAVNKFNNDVERIIYTLREENQGAAMQEVFDNAIKYNESGLY